MSTNQRDEQGRITSLTPEQEALVPAYVERYRQYGLDTTTDRAAAEAAVSAAYAHLKYKQPKFIWEISAFAGAKKAAQLAKGSDDVTKDEIAAQADKASYGSLEAYWVAFYAFATEVLPIEKDPLVDVVKDLVKHCGVYWTFDDVVVMTPKPPVIHVKDDKLHNEHGPAIEYADGTCVYAYEGERFSSLAEVTLRALVGNNDETTDSE